MNSEHNKAKPRRFRFSIRTLVITVTLACCYAACWGPTKEHGPNDVIARETRSGTIIHNTSPVMPLVVSMHWEGGTPSRPKWVEHWEYYFWFFGYTAKLPYGRELP